MRSITGDKPRRTVLVLLALLLLAHLANNMFWARHNDLPNGWAEAVELNRELEISGLLDGRPLHAAGGVISGEIYYYRPALFSVIVHFFTLLAGRSYFSMTVVTTLFFVLLLASVYATGALLKDRLTGLLSAFILSMYPVIYGFSRLNNLELPVIAWVAGSFYVLLLSERFSRSRYSVLFGAMLGLGMMSDRLVCLIYTGGAVGYILLSNIIDFLRERKWKDIVRKIFNVCAALSIAMLIAWPYYSVWMARNSEYVLAKASGVDPRGLCWGVYYILSTCFLMSPFMFFVFVFGIAGFLRWKHKEKYLLAIWAGVPYVFYSSLQYKEPQFLSSILPACALVSAISLMNLRSRIMRGCLVALVLAAGLYGFIRGSYFTDGMDRRFDKWDISKGMVLSRKPEPASRQFIGFLDAFRCKDAASIGIIDHIPRSFNPWPLSDEGMAFLLKIRYPGVKVAMCNICDPLDRNNPASVRKFFSGRGYDYVFYLTSDRLSFPGITVKPEKRGVSDVSRKNIVYSVLNGLAENMVFKNSVEMADGSVIYVFSRQEDDNG